MIDYNIVRCGRYSAATPVRGIVPGLADIALPENIRPATDDVLVTAETKLLSNFCSAATVGVKIPCTWGTLIDSTNIVITVIVPISNDRNCSVRTIVVDRRAHARNGIYVVWVRSANMVDVPIQQHTVIPHGQDICRSIPVHVPNLRYVCRKTEAERRIHANRGIVRREWRCTRNAIVNVPFETIQTAVDANCNGIVVSITIHVGDERCVSRQPESEEIFLSRVSIGIAEPL